MTAVEACDREVFEGDNEEAEGPIDLELGLIVGKRWKVMQKLGEGGCGSIYKVQDIRTKTLAALKAESILIDGGVLKLEVKILKRLAGRRHVAHLYQSGKKSTYGYMVTKLLGPSLDKLTYDTKKTSSISTQVRIGVHCLFGLKQLHEVGFVHRDVKPANLALGYSGREARIFHLLDFGLCREFVLRNRKTGALELRKPRIDTPFRGTTHYASVSALKGNDQGRVDDLWSMLYMLAELRDKLPWDDLTEKATICQSKMDTNDVELLYHSPPKFVEIAAHLRGLTYSSRPNYLLMFNVFDSIMVSSHFSHSDRFDWEDIDEKPLINSLQEEHVEPKTIIMVGSSEEEIDYTCCSFMKMEKWPVVDPQHSIRTAAKTTLCSTPPSDQEDQSVASGCPSDTSIGAAATPAESVLTMPICFWMREPATVTDAKLLKTPDDESGPQEAKNPMAAVKTTKSATKETANAIGGELEAHRENTDNRKADKTKILEEVVTVNADTKNKDEPAKNSSDATVDIKRPDGLIKGSKKADGSGRTDNVKNPDGTADTKKVDSTVKTSDVKKAHKGAKTARWKADGSIKTTDAAKVDNSSNTAVNQKKAGVKTTDVKRPDGLIKGSKKADGSGRTTNVKNPGGTADTKKVDSTVKTSDVKKADKGAKAVGLKKPDGSIKTTDAAKVDNSCKTGADQKKADAKTPTTKKAGGTFKKLFAKKAAMPKAAKAKCDTAKNADTSKVDTDDTKKVGCKKEQINEAVAMKTDATVKAAEDNKAVEVKKEDDTKVNDVSRREGDTKTCLTVKADSNDGCDPQTGTISEKDTEEQKHSDSQGKTDCSHCCERTKECHKEDACVDDVDRLFTWADFFSNELGF